MLSFPLDDVDEPACASWATSSIAPAVAARNNPGDPDGELRLLLVHGILHLLGYDHEDDAERAGCGRARSATAGCARRDCGCGCSPSCSWSSGRVLAAAEASLTRMTRVRALALEEEGRRNAALLVRSRPIRPGT